jgi:outer membrane protein, heavy metal efflux system
MRHIFKATNGWAVRNAILGMLMLSACGPDLPTEYPKGSPLATSAWACRLFGVDWPCPTCGLRLSQGSVRVSHASGGALRQAGPLSEVRYESGEATMRARVSRKVATSAMLVWLAGCASGSTTQDVKDVHSLTSLASLPELAKVPQGEVDAEPAREVETVLREPLTAQAAVRLGLLNNRELRARLRELGITRGALVQAGTLPNPTVEVELLPERNSALELRVEYDLTKLLLVPVRANAAHADLDAARYDAAGGTIELGFRVRAGFYAAQAAEQKLQVTQRMLDTFAAARDAARALRSAGNIPALDLAAHEAQYERARITVAKAELDAFKAREALNRWMGTHGTHTAWKLQGGLVAPSADLAVREQVEVDALVASLELKAAKSKLEGLAQKAGATRTEGLLPDVAADVHLLAGDPSAALGADKAWRFGGGVKVGLPLFDRKQGRTLALLSAFDAQLERYYGLAVTLRSITREVRAELTSAYARTRQYQSVILPAQKQLTEQTLLQYNAMQVALFQLLAAKRDELDAELAYIDTLREYWTVRAAFEALLAGHRVERAGMMVTSGESGGSGATGEH